MGFGCGLASSVLRPVHAISHQLQHRRVHDMNGHLEAEGRSPAPPGHKSGRLFAQVIHHLPKQLLGHLGRSLPVGIGKPVAAGRARTANSRQRARVQLQGITHVIQANAMGQLRIAQAHHMAPRAEGPCLLLHACLSGQVRDPMGWNIVAELTENCEFRRGWKFGFFHDLSCDRSSSDFQPF